MNTAWVSAIWSRCCWYLIVHSSPVLLSLWGSGRFDLAGSLGGPSVEVGGRCCRGWRSMFCHRSPCFPLSLCHWRIHWDLPASCFCWTFWLCLFVFICMRCTAFFYMSLYGILINLPSVPQLLFVRVWGFALVDFVYIWLHYSVYILLHIDIFIPWAIDLILLSKLTQIHPQIINYHQLPDMPHSKSCSKFQFPFCVTAILFCEKYLIFFWSANNFGHVYSLQK